MANKEEYRNLCKNIIAIFFLLFALAPCTVKESVLSQFGIEYYRPLNKVKSASQRIVGCSFATKEIGSKTAIIKIPCKLVNRIPSAIAQHAFFSAAGKQWFNTCNGAVAGNSPPRYILFKRLKLHLV